MHSLTLSNPAISSITTYTHTLKHCNIEKLGKKYCRLIRHPKQSPYSTQTQNESVLLNEGIASSSRKYLPANYIPIP